MGKIYQPLFTLIYNYRRKHLLADVLNRIILLIMLAILLIFFLFFIHQFFFLGKSVLQFWIPFTIFCFAQLFYFFVNNHQFWENRWKETFATRLPSEFDHYRDSIFNLIDLEKKNILSELEIAYLDTLKIEKFPKYKFFLNYNYLILFFSIFAVFFTFFLLKNSFSQFTRHQLFQKISRNEFYITFQSPNIKAVADSTVTVKFEHNIPDMYSLLLKVTNMDESNEYFVHLNFNKSEFSFTNWFNNQGKIFLEARHSILGKIISDTLSFEFIRRFKIMKHTVKIYLPRYTKLRPYTISNISDISVLAGVNIKWGIKFSKPNVRIESNFKEKEHQFSFQVTKPFKFSFKAIDADSQALTFLSKEINVVRDKAPLLILNNPTSDIDVSDATPIFFYISGIDDFGFSKIVIRYYTVNRLLNYRTEWKEVILLRDQANVFQKQINWPITNLDVFPGMDIYYQFVAWDNNSISGFQKAETKIQKIHLLSLEEIFAKMNEKQDEIRNEITKNISKRSKIISKIEKYRLKMKQKGKLSFADKQNLEKLFTKLDELNKKANNIEKNLQKLQREAEKNDIFSEKILDQLKELQDLFKEMNLIKKEKTRKSVHKMTSSEIKKEISDVTDAEKKMMAEMKRIKSILEKLKEKQREHQLVAQLKEFKKEQKTINRLAKSDEKKSDKEQSKLAQELDTFQKKKSNSSLKKRMVDLLKKNSILAKMKSSIADKTEVKTKKRKEIQENIESIEKQFQQLLIKQNTQEKKKLLNDMFELIQKTLYLSFTQEKLVNQSKNVSIYSNRFKELTRSQQLIKDFSYFIREKLTEIANRSLLFNQKIITVLSKAISHTAFVIDHLEQRQNWQATLKQQDILGYFNQTVLMLTQNKKSMSKATSAIGEKEFMKQMKNISNTQKGINQSTQSMWEMLKNQLAEKKLAGRKRLSQNARQKSNEGKPSSSDIARQQSQLANQLADLMKNNMNHGKRAGTHGRSSEMIKEMRKIASELRIDRLNKELIKRQRKLLQKMLDAVSAGQENDKKTKRREKEDVRNFVVKDIKQLDKNLGQKHFIIQDYYEKAMKVSYQNNLKQLIEHYFNNLMKMDSLRIN